MFHDAMVQLVKWSVDLVDSVGYPGILFLMWLESTVFPFPSELVMPQAGVLAFQGKMNGWVAVLMGTVGSCLGALTNYYISSWVGRPLILRYGKYFFCPPHKFEKAERFFRMHGEIGTFTGRLVPVVRHLISIPAGLARMDMLRFQFFTAAGAGIWCAVLVGAGYACAREKDKIEPLLRRWTVEILVGCAVLLALYVWRHARRAKNAAA